MVGPGRARALLALPLLAACTLLDEHSAAMRRADTAEFAQTLLVGLSKAEILACAGKPDRVVRSGDEESLVYASTDPAKAKAGASADKACEVTFVVRRGFVEKVAYSVPGIGGFGSGEQCAYVVQKCMRTR